MVEDLNLGLSRTNPASSQGGTWASYCKPSALTAWPRCLLLFMTFYHWVIRIKFLLVISILCKTEWSWELRTWSHKMTLLDILSTSRLYFCGKWIGATNENLNFDHWGFKGLSNHDDGDKLKKSQSKMNLRYTKLYRVYLATSIYLSLKTWTANFPGVYL